MARDFLYCEETDTKIYSDDVVTISSYPDVKFIAKKGWYKIGNAQQNGWYFLNITDKSIIPVDQINIAEISKDTEQGTSEYRPTLKDIDSVPAENNYIVIPGTNIRLYDSDIVKIFNKPRTKWVVHVGWYIYNDVQNFGWYFECIKDGAILPVSAIDLTLVTLDTTKTQGSGRYDGQVVNYTRPFTLADAEILSRTFITLDTIEQRDNIDPKKLVNGKMVRVNSEEGAATYYYWDETAQSWELLEAFGIPSVVGTFTNPIILSELEPGLYRVKGNYKISPNHPDVFITVIDHLAFVAGSSDINIKLITEDNIADYVVHDGDVTLYTEYATKTYVDNTVTALELRIPSIVEEILNAYLEPIDNDYIDSLFE